MNDAPRSMIFSRSHLKNSRVIAAIAAILCCGLCAARADTLLLKNAIVHTVTGDVITNGSVLVDGNRIAQVGGSGENLSGDKTMDLNGRHLYPGMIIMDSALGLTEIEAVRATDDMAEVGSYNPDVQAWIAVNPDSELLPVARANGLGYFECAPAGGTIAGMSGVVALSGWTTEQMTIKKLAGLHLYWPDMSIVANQRRRFRGPGRPKSLEEQVKEREKNLKELDDFFQEARAYEKARTANNKDFNVNPPYEAMVPVVRGDVPIMVHANEIRQIKAAVKWAETNHFKIVLVGGAEAGKAAAMLSEAKIPVVFEGVYDVPNRDTESYDVFFRTPEVLRKAGVKVVFSGGPGNGPASLAKNLPYLASQAVAFGYPESEALKGITLYPAQVLGVDARLGSIERGKEATLFVCDGDILDIRAQVTHLWIAGKEVSLESRHTRLYEKYKNRPTN